MPQRRTVSRHIRINSIVVPGKENCRAVTSDISGYDHRISGSRKFSRCRYTVNNFTDSGRRDKTSVCLPLSRDLGIPRDQINSHLSRCLFHRGHDLLQIVHGKSLFYDKGTGHVKRSGAHARQIVDRSAD